MLRVDRRLVYSCGELICVCGVRYFRCGWFVVNSTKTILREHFPVIKRLQAINHACFNFLTCEMFTIYYTQPSMLRSEGHLPTQHFMYLCLNLEDKLQIEV